MVGMAPGRAFWGGLRGFCECSKQEIWSLEVDHLDTPPPGFFCKCAF
jgi:hypothetical protein